METEDSRGKVVTLSRRAVVLGAASIAAGLAVGGVATAFDQNEDLLRPPGGQDAARFMGLCIRCDRCRSACPTNAIGITDIEEGLSTVRTPVMRFRLGYCDTCDGAYRCIASCPTGALGSFDALQDKIGLAKVDADVCLLYNRSAHCDARCVDACEWDALEKSDDGRLTVDASKCNGCGACEYVCVSKAYGNYSTSGKRGINVEAAQGGE